VPVELHPPLGWTPDGHACADRVAGQLALLRRLVAEERQRLRQVQKRQLTLFAPIVPLTCPLTMQSSKHPFSPLQSPPPSHSTLAPPDSPPQPQPPGPPSSPAPVPPPTQPTECDFEDEELPELLEQEDEDGPTSDQVRGLPTAPIPHTPLRAGELPKDHVVRCGCGCGGTAFESVARAPPPRVPLRQAAQPAGTLRSVMLAGTGAIAAALERASARVSAEQPDDQMVLEGGCGPGLVHLLETEYPTCRRMQMSLCRDGQLGLYGAEYQNFEHFAMRAMYPEVYELGVAAWRADWHNLPESAQVGS